MKGHRQQDERVRMIRRSAEERFDFEWRGVGLRAQAVSEERCTSLGSKKRDQSGRSLSKEVRLQFV
jgi:hypothetical protein